MQQSIWIILVTIVVFMAVIMGVCAYLVFLERKVSAWMQDRVGPNRVGPFGLLQPLADGLKFLFKEEIVPGHVDKLFFLLAPSIAVMTALLAAAVVPFGATDPNDPQRFQFVIAPGVDIGILFTFAVGSLAVWAIVLGGWSSNNKYSLLGALRSSAQVISYEIPLGMSIVGVVLMTGSLNLERIIQQQVEGGWNILYQPLAFLIFMTAVMAECNRMPFDLPECEQELVGGYHTEYSALKFGLFFVGEYTHLVTTSLMLTTVFLGGWHFPWIATADSGWPIKFVVMMAKLGFFIMLYMVIRWTIPRFRFDQLMAIAWKRLIPLALLNLVAVMVVKEMGWSVWWLLPASVVLLLGTAAALSGGEEQPQAGAFGIGEKEEVVHAH